MCVCVCVCVYVCVCVCKKSKVGDRSREGPFYLHSPLHQDGKEGAIHFPIIALLYPCSLPYKC